MSSCADKCKEVAVASKGFKRLRKGVASRSSAEKASPTRWFVSKAMEEHGLKGFNAQKETKSFNAFLGTPVVDPEMYFMFLEKPPYRDIFNTLCGDHSAAW
ncbi:hypothetical protein HAX54_044848 [Datura stramonium]|uniref:Uncharacterized protein n=1 Tax=Datura stramonium TaxID=4076 RepID=A0ABS8WIX1_DATST|nr:hypothetical protein [Datura stramonium]